MIEEFVRSDAATSAATVSGRNSLLSLIQDAKRAPRPFDRILVDDTSRLARDTADSLNLIERLQYLRVPETFVSQGIDSEQSTARQLLTLNGMMDEQYLVSLADKVHRGQEGNTRTFSIASAPYEVRLMFVTRVRDTAFRRSLKKVPLGTAVQMSPAMGSFTQHKNSGKPAGFLAAMFPLGMAGFVRPFGKATDITC